MFDKGKKMDLESLDELIEMCERAMISPFKKKKVVEVDLTAVDDEGDEGRQAAAEEQEDDEKPDLSDVDVQDLLEAYRELKDRE